MPFPRVSAQTPISTGHNIKQQFKLNRKVNCLFVMANTIMRSAYVIHPHPYNWTVLLTTMIRLDAPNAPTSNIAARAAGQCWSLLKWRKDALLDNKVLPIKFQKVFWIYNGRNLIDLKINFSGQLVPKLHFEELNLTQFMRTNLNTLSCILLDVFLFLGLCGSHDSPKTFSSFFILKPPPFKQQYFWLLSRKI